MMWKGWDGGSSRTGLWEARLIEIPRLSGCKEAAEGGFLRMRE